MFSFLLQRMYYDRRRTDKDHPGQNLPDKKPGQNSHNKNPHELRQTPCKDVFMHVLLKIGSPRCVTYFREVPRCVTKCDRGRVSKLVQNSVTYFMDGPYFTFKFIF